MFGFDKRLGLLPLLIGLGIAGSAVAGGQIDGKTQTGVQCGIAETRQNGMISLEAVVLGDTTVNGNYELALQSSGGGGSSNVNQGGAFTAPAHEVTTLGRMSINTGSRYDIDFTLTVNGDKIDCN